MNDSEGPPKLFVLCPQMFVLFGQSLEQTVLSVVGRKVFDKFAFFYLND
jgi:hypothetical protein